MRRNLDPLDRHQEAELWEVLEGVGLKNTITELPLKLDHLVVDNGSNFSLVRRGGEGGGEGTRERQGREGGGAGEREVERG